MDPHPSLSTNGKASTDTDQSPQQRYEHLISAFPLEASMPLALRKYQGFWVPERHLPGVMALQAQFVARPSDVLLITLPKSGTTWLKALAFATLHRNKYAFTDHPLLTANPHECVPFLELLFLSGQAVEPHDSTEPRLLAAHMPISLLPSSVKESGCRIIYLCRDPRDVLISGWHFLKAMKPGSTDAVTLSHVCDLICAGKGLAGPVWDHVLEYWRESQSRPDEVLFLKYEDMMENIEGSVRRLAEFLGCAFSEEEEKGGVVEEIIRLCSFDKLTSLDVNKSAAQTKASEGGRGVNGAFQNTWFFRKGKVGDWKNHLTPEMAQKLDEILQEKFHGTGLSFP